MPEDNRDLVLPPNTFAYVLDETKGIVSIYVGPYKNSLSATDRLVVWDASRRRFAPVDATERAIQVFQTAREGQYIVLHDPAVGGNHPPKGNSTMASDLEMGRQVNVPGPDAFALWPGQTAQTIDGHHLRHNQYLLVRVYDAEQATANWERAVVVTQTTAVDGETDSPPPAPAASIDPQRFTTGQLIIVNGTEVSFYIPPTGIEVVPAAGEGTGVSIGPNGAFVREAVTLERLEYCILLDESGEKRYVQGPAVVFPRPTEQFISDRSGARKFRAVELNLHSGIYIKVIAEYDDEDGNHPVGEELFITGAQMPVYFPRAEQGIIQYSDDRQVHYAIAIPAGEGRYVLDRDTGEVKLVRGTAMYLPDPRHEVVVLRILDPHTCDLYYPGNEEALAVNLERAGQAMNFDDSQQERRLRSTLRSKGVLRGSTEAAYSVSTVSNAGLLVGGQHDIAMAGAAAPEAPPGDTFRRGSSYTRPRSIVLDTKYEGAVTLSVWPGYAVLVQDKEDNRRVEVGPKVVLLEYDETIMALELSTGRPKDDRNLLRTGYLRIVNNQVSDRITVETRDLVKVTVDVSYRVNFEGETQEEMQRWFALENYIKVLSDHCRSRLRNVAKRHGILEFYTGTIDIIRDALLGVQSDEGREGLFFEANGMRLFDVEVLDVSIENDEVADLLVGAQSDSLSGAIALTMAEDQTARNQRLQELKRSDLEEAERTAIKQSEIRMAEIARQMERNLAELEDNLARAVKQMEINTRQREDQTESAQLEIALSAARQQQSIDYLVAETDQLLRRMESMGGNFVTALQQFGDRSFVTQLTTAMGPVAAAMGVTTADIFKQFFKDTPFEKAIETMTIRPFAVETSNSSR